jgi:hydrogenase maturation protease
VVIAVIGCGNPNRSDDGAGPAVIAALRENPALSTRDDLRLLDAGTDGMAVMFAARGCTSLILVDACSPLETPGALYEVPGHELVRIYEPSMTFHDFRWNHALFAGRKIYGESFPDDVTVYLIEAQCLDIGLSLSPPVQAAVSQLAGRIVARLTHPALT